MINIVYAERLGINMSNDDDFLREYLTAQRCVHELFGMRFNEEQMRMQAGRNLQFLKDCKANERDKAHKR